MKGGDGSCPEVSDQGPQHYSICRVFIPLSLPIPPNRSNRSKPFQPFQTVPILHWETREGDGVQGPGSTAPPVITVIFILFFRSPQWEYQVGPCEGISSGDELWISRYLLEVPLHINVSMEIEPSLSVCVTALAVVPTGLVATKET